MQDTLAHLLDRVAIHDLLARYCRGVDRKDWPAVRACFHADAHDDHAEYKGGVDGFIAWVTKRHAHVPQSMHFLGNCLIEFAGKDLAIVETYFMTAHTLGPKAQKEYGAGDGSSPVQLSAYGRYADRMERRNGKWGIARRIVIFEATRTFTGKAPGLKPEWSQARRDKDDPIFRMRAEAGL